MSEKVKKLLEVGDVDARGEVIKHIQNNFPNPHVCTNVEHYWYYPALNKPFQVLEPTEYDSGDGIRILEPGIYYFAGAVLEKSCRALVAQRIEGGILQETYNIACADKLVDWRGVVPVKI